MSGASVLVAHLDVENVYRAYEPVLQISVCMIFFAQLMLQVHETSVEGT